MCAAGRACPARRSSCCSAAAAAVGMTRSTLRPALRFGRWTQLTSPASPTQPPRHRRKPRPFQRCKVRCVRPASVDAALGSLGSVSCFVRRRLLLPTLLELALILPRLPRGCRRVWLPPAAACGPCGPALARAFARPQQQASAAAAVVFTSLQEQLDVFLVRRGLSMQVVACQPTVASSVPVTACRACCWTPCGPCSLSSLHLTSYPACRSSIDLLLDPMLPAAARNHRHSIDTLSELLRSPAVSGVSLAFGASMHYCHWCWWGRGTALAGFVSQPVRPLSHQPTSARC